MKIAHVNYSDIRGGAAIAAYRLHHGLLHHGIDSRMCVNWSQTDEAEIDGPENIYKTALALARRPVGEIVAKALKTPNRSLHSPALLPSAWPGRLSGAATDLVHLHWLGWEMMSVRDVSKLDKPMVWTLHDMWPFCGAEHYTEDLRWQSGYFSNNRPAYERGFDLNRSVWQRKRKYWTNPIQMIAPSRWVADCVAQSDLMKGWPVTILPNPIDTSLWAPVEKTIARQLYGFKPEKKILGFGAINGGQDPRKGIDLLLSALKLLRGEIGGLELVVFGQSAPKTPIDYGFPIRYMGHLHDTMSLRVLYSAMDVMVVPSRQETFGQTASEALACGTPVAAFGATGLLDVVKHQQTGWLANPYDVEDLARGVAWLLKDDCRHQKMCAEARADVVRRFDSAVVIPHFVKLYQNVIEAH